jgi:ATP-dependent protease ClpP protease subunit
MQEVRFALRKSAMADQTEYRIVFPDSVTIDTANILRSRIVGALSQQDFGSLTILFSSEGGSTDQSMSLYNFIRQLPIAVHMHAVGHVGSAAFPIFLAADKRTSAKHARFFLHEYDWGFRDRQTLHRIQEATDRLKSDIALAKNIIQSRTKIPASLLAAIGGDGPPTIITPDDAKKTTLWRHL